MLTMQMRMRLLFECYPGAYMLLFCTVKKKAKYIYIYELFFQ